MSRYEDGDYPTYMRTQSKNALKAMAAALKHPAPPDVTDPEARSEVDVLCEALERRECAPWSFAGQRIARAVAKAHRLTFTEMISHRRHRHLAYARQEAMYLMARHTTLSLPQIGRILGNRDHTTVIHGIRVHTHRLANAQS
jgi:chromosomal replication initiation ATPase DnaA